MHYILELPLPTICTVVGKILSESYSRKVVRMVISPNTQYSFDVHLQGRKLLWVWKSRHHQERMNHTEVLGVDIDNLLRPLWLPYLVQSSDQRKVLCWYPDIPISPIGNRRSFLLQDTSYLSQHWLIIWFQTRVSTFLFFEMWYILGMRIAMLLI